MPVNKNSKSKWQDASNTVNSFRWKLADLLRTFNDVEKKTHNYKDLIKEIKDGPYKAIRDVSPADAKEEKEKEEKIDKINWKSKKTWMLIFSSPALVEGIKYIPTVYNYINSFLTGQPPIGP